LIFFDILINKKNKPFAERYLENNLRKTLLELNQTEMRSKEKYFFQILKNSDGLNWKKLLNTNYKRLLNLLKKFYGIIDYQEGLNDFKRMNNHTKNDGNIGYLNFFMLSY
jgi:hypothetical protein